LHTVEPTATGLSVRTCPRATKCAERRRDLAPPGFPPPLARSLLLGGSGRALSRHATEIVGSYLPGLRQGSGLRLCPSSRVCLSFRLTKIYLSRLHCFLTQASLFPYA